MENEKYEKKKGEDIKKNLPNNSYLYRIKIYNVGKFRIRFITRLLPHDSSGEADGAVLFVLA